MNDQEIWDNFAFRLLPIVWKESEEKDNRFIARTVADICDAMMAERSGRLRNTYKLTKKDMV